MVRKHLSDSGTTNVQFSLITLSILFFLLMSGVCSGQQSSSVAAYPQRPIRLILGWPPGASTDILARLVSQKLTSNLKQQVIVDNRPGAGGLIGSRIVAEAIPDGYTLLLTISSLSTIPAVNPNASYDPVRDFTPLMLIAQSPSRVVVNPKVPANTIQELFALMKAKPGSLNYGTPGNGTPVHLAIELFKSMSGVNIVHVPYKGNGPAMTDLIGGQIQIMFAGTLASIPQVKAGRIRALAVTSSQRRPDSPELPTIAETILPGYEHMEWFGVIAPPGLPKPLLARIHAELTRAIKDPEIRDRLSEDGMDLVVGGPDEFAAIIKRDFAKWKRVVKENKITAD